MLWKGLGGLRTDAGQDPLELHDVFLDATDDVNESFIVVPGWIWQIPIIVESLADIGTSHVAAHGDRGVRFWNIRNQLGVLRFLHVDAVKLFHESYGILIDLRLGFHTCGIKSQSVPRRCFPNASAIWLRHELCMQIKATFLIAFPVCDVMISRLLSRIIRFAQCSAFTSSNNTMPGTTMS